MNLISGGVSSPSMNTEVGPPAAYPLTDAPPSVVVPVVVVVPPFGQDNRTIDPLFKFYSNSFRINY